MYKPPGTPTARRFVSLARHKHSTVYHSLLYRPVMRGETLRAFQRKPKHDKAEEVHCESAKDTFISFHCARKISHFLTCQRYSLSVAEFFIFYIKKPGSFLHFLPQNNRSSSSGNEQQPQTVKDPPPPPPSPGPKGVFSLT